MTCCSTLQRCIMAKIIELDSHVADLIAAGEVVEKPASVVKELMENSIDAGAGVVTVEITAGGMTYIRVTDNGCGIAPGEVKTAFLRHATSKLRDAAGLEAIGTLGFRGEALAAIAAVSRIDLLTREQGSDEGVSLSLEGGKLCDFAPAGCPEGTTIIVRDLFFNTPARLKFMKTDRAEGSSVSSAVLRCALSHPEVSVRYIRDGKSEFHTPGDSRVDSCIYSLFGREFFAGLLPAFSSDEVVSVTGFVSAPSAARGNRSYQFFFVNGRPIRSATLQAALEQAFANKLTSGRFPSGVLYITTGPGNVDVNVHPAKTEVKFVSDKQVFDGVYYATTGALQRMASVTDGGVVESGGTGTISDTKRGDGFKSMQVDEYLKKYNTGNGSSDSGSHRHSSSAVQGGSYTPHDSPAQGGSRMPGRPHIPSDSLSQDDSRIPDDTLIQDDSSADVTRQLSPAGAITAGAFTEVKPRIIGEALKMYIIVEHKNSVWFIDKHAAHERIHFNTLKSSGFEPMAQALIAPVVCRLGVEGAAVVLENTELFDKLGFTVESFGDDAIAIRRIPADIELGDAEQVLSEICAELSRGGSAADSRQDAIFRSVACKAAIKAGKSTNINELEALVGRVMSGEITHCPHGRPVMFELTKPALDKAFKRI